MLVPDRPMPHCAALLVDRFLGASHAILRRHLAHRRSSCSRFHPYMRESKKVKTCRQHLLALILDRLRLAPEIDHGGLVRVKFHPVFPKPFANAPPPRRAAL